MVTNVISELKSVSRLKILPETGPRCYWYFLQVYKFYNTSNY